MFQRAPKDAFHAEKFIYYDGLMKAPATPGIERDGEAVVLATNFGFPLHDLVALERDEKGLRLPAEPLETLPAGERKTRVELKPCAKADEAAAIARLEKTLAERLAAAGLHADEARALIEVWRPGLWQRPGLTVFYRVPQEVYESWLPLAAQPAPAKTVRVGVVLHECLEPELEARVEALIKALGAEGFEDREDARKALLEIGGAVFPQLEAHAKGKDEQIAQSCRDILAALDVLPALSEPPAKKP
ncbi:MAG: hypothetical protein M5U26_00415 [Planctomycetota bacterium]|nr:hypothetical protein [Planctomycetota bacterium]